MIEKATENLSRLVPYEMVDGLTGWLVMDALWSANVLVGVVDALDAVAVGALVDLNATEALLNHEL